MAENRPEVLVQSADSIQAQSMKHVAEDFGKMSLSRLMEMWPTWNAEPENASGPDTFHPIHDSWHNFSDSASEPPLLYLGGNAIRGDVIVSLGISHILSLVSSKRGQKPVDAGTAEIQQLTLDIEDDYDADIRVAFRSAFAFLEEIEKCGGLCYVHCEQGRSRSASVVIAWLMHRRARLGQRPSLLECYSAVASRRRVSALNYGFFARLCDLEASLALAAYGSHAGTPSLSLLDYFLLHQQDKTLFAYPPPPSYKELLEENGLEVNDQTVTGRQRAIRRLLRGFCYVLKELQHASPACQQTWTQLQMRKCP